MYKSPIQVDFDLSEVVRSIEENLEAEIFKAVCSVGISVDKEELEAALAYDRRQYEAGKHDGIIGALAQIRTACKSRAGCNGCEYFSGDQRHGHCRLTGQPYKWEVEE